MTINTDNRLITDTTVSKELWLVHTRDGRAVRDIKSMIVAGFKSSFQPFHEKQAALRRVAAELDRYADDGSLRAAAAARAIRLRARASERRVSRDERRSER